MARIYAGILGPLAVLTFLVRGVINAEGVNSTLLAAWCGLLVFAPVGYVVGWLADKIVAESVRAVVSSEIPPDQRDY